MPSTVEDFRSGRYQKLVELFEVDNFGSKGDRFLLDQLGIFEGPLDFMAKASQLVVDYQHEHAETWWRSEGLLHQRVVSYTEFELCRPGKSLPLSGERFQQNGFHGTRQMADRIMPTTLPFNHNVDRSLCSEFQLLAGLCEDFFGPVPGDERACLDGVQGWLHLFVTGAPCLSCVGAMRQFQLLLPLVRLKVSIGAELQYAALEACAPA